MKMHPIWTPQRAMKPAIIEPVMTGEANSAPDQHGTR